MHPVYDFLFQYYRFRPSAIRRWSPGWGIVLEDAADDPMLPTQVKECPGRPGGRWLDPAAFPERRRPSLEWTIQLLRETLDRPPMFGCDGLHEWAMVYRSPDLRHATYPLRVSPGEVEALVDSRTLLCTHFDAVRFYTKDARPLNRFDLRREQRPAQEQRGCLHTNMDLYKWSFKWMPWIPSDILFAALQIAIRAREVDMRASPYDLRSLGFEPIRIEKACGQEEYRRLQREIAAAAQPVRSKLLYSLSELHDVTARPLSPDFSPCSV